MLLHAAARLYCNQSGMGIVSRLFWSCQGGIEMNSYAEMNRCDDGIA